MRAWPQPHLWTNETICSNTPIWSSPMWLLCLYYSFIFSYSNDFAVTIKVSCAVILEWSYQIWEHKLYSPHSCYVCCTHITTKKKSRLLVWFYYCLFCVPTNCNITLRQVLAQHSPFTIGAWNLQERLNPGLHPNVHRPFSVHVYTSQSSLFLITVIEKHFHSQLPPRLPPVFPSLMPTLNQAAQSLMSSGINHVSCVSSLMCVWNGDHITLLYFGKGKLVSGKDFFFFFLTSRVMRNIPTQSGSTFCPNKPCSGHCWAGRIYFHKGRVERRLTARLSAGLCFCFLTATAFLSVGYACGGVISGDAGQHLYHVGLGEEGGCRRCS